MEEKRSKVSEEYKQTIYYRFQKNNMNHLLCPFSYGEVEDSLLQTLRKIKKTSYI